MRGVWVNQQLHEYKRLVACLGSRESRRKGGQRDSMKNEGANMVYKRLVVEAKEHRELESKGRKGVEGEPMNIG